MVRGGRGTDHGALRSAETGFLTLADEGPKPTDFELARVIQLQQELLELYRKDPKSAGQLVAGLKLENVPAEELASWISIARTILNLDEMITRE